MGTIWNVVGGRVARCSGRARGSIRRTIDYRAGALDAVLFDFGEEGLVTDAQDMGGAALVPTCAFQYLPNHAAFRHARGRRSYLVQRALERNLSGVNLRQL